MDNFIGDAIIAVWGTPETALRSQLKLAELRAAPDVLGRANIRARIGIALGDVLVGNVGSHERFNYTVMGDTLNPASRLESLNKLYGTEILISDPAYRQARESIAARPVGVVQVKGKREWHRKMTLSHASQRGCSFRHSRHTSRETFGRFIWNGAASF